MLLKEEWTMIYQWIDLLKDVQFEGTIEDLGSKVRLEEVSQEGKC